MEGIGEVRDAVICADCARTEYFARTSPIHATYKNSGSLNRIDVMWLADLQSRMPLTKINEEDFTI